MFGYVTANWKELDDAQRKRYSSVYCGICRAIRDNSSQSARLFLSYDMAFLALLLMSLYEPEEESGTKPCALHPIKPRNWVDNAYIRYAADMNVVLAYYKAMDDKMDDHALSAKLSAKLLQPRLHQIHDRFPRQCDAIASCLQELSQLEKEGCANPDEPAACFGSLMAQLFLYKDDMWSPALSQMGMALGRFIYLTDAAVDYRRDKRKHKYNPFLAMNRGENWAQWEQYLILTMARCTQAYETLPLVQDKPLLDRILYSGVWAQFRRKQPRKQTAQEEIHDQ